MRKGSHEKLPSRQANNPAMTQEYTVTRVTAERVAINHLETTSSQSHSFLSSILMSCHEALRHIAKLMCISLSSVDKKNFQKSDVGIILSFVKSDTIGQVSGQIVLTHSEHRREFHIAENKQECISMLRHSFRMPIFDMRQRNIQDLKRIVS